MYCHDHHQGFEMTQTFFCHLSDWHQYNVYSHMKMSLRREMGMYAWPGWAYYSKWEKVRLQTFLAKLAYFLSQCVLTLNCLRKHGKSSWKGCQEHHDLMVDTRCTICRHHRHQIARCNASRNAASPWFSCWKRKIAGCACTGNAGTVFPATAG